MKANAPKIKAPDSENMNVAPTIQKKRYNTRAASRRALGDITNAASSSNVGEEPKNNRCIVPTVKKHAVDTACSIVIKGEEANEQADPRRTYTKHVLVDPILDQAYASSFKLPLGVVDIDFPDRVARNHLAESTLAITIHRGHMNREFASMPAPDYLLKCGVSPRVRSILVDWLVDVHKTFKLKQSTLFQAVNMVDRFLSTKDTVVALPKLQLVGVACMWIASKYEEMYPPHIEDYVYISAKTYTKKEILAMEALVCNKLNFVFTVPTSLPFAARGLKAYHALHPDADERITPFTHYALELALCDYRMLKYRPSLVAAGAIHIASQKLAYQRAYWDANMCFHTGGYTADDLYNCVNDLGALIDLDGDEYSTKVRAVRQKYSTDKFKQVSLIIPAFYSKQLCSNEQDAMDVVNQHQI